MVAIACIAGVDWDNFVAMRLHVLGRKKTRTVPLSGQADDGNGLGRFENVP
jgi:hypothetical protein